MKKAKAKHGPFALDALRGQGGREVPLHALSRLLREHPRPESWGAPHTKRRHQNDAAEATEVRCAARARCGLTFFTLACSALESFSAFLASFSSCFAVN